MTRRIGKRKNMKIGARLKYIRKRSNLSLEKISKIFDVTAQTISRYENAERSPDIEFLELFGKHFKLSANWLLYGEKPIFREEKENESEKDIRQLFLELSSILPGKFENESIPILKASIENITKDDPENYLMMLAYMLKDAKVRKNIFQFFFLFQKPDADQPEKK